MHFNLPVYESHFFKSKFCLGFKVGMTVTVSSMSPGISAMLQGLKSQKSYCVNNCAELHNMGESVFSRAAKTGVPENGALC
jgi:hypothetical protein